MELLIRGGVILACDPSQPDVFGGDLLIVDGRIVSISADHVVAPNATIVDASGSIVMPGLVDAHQHVWEADSPIMHPDSGMARYFTEWIPQHAPEVTPESLFVTTTRALRRAMRAGTTLTFDWCHATNTLQHAEAALAAANETGSRYVFGYGPPVAFGYYGSDLPHPAELEVFTQRVAECDRERVRGAAALRGPDLSPDGVWQQDVARARAVGLPMSMHVSTRRNGSGAVTALHEAGLLGSDIQLVHATDASDEEMLIAAEAGVKFAVPAIAELLTGAGEPPLHRLASHGIEYALGIDTTLASPYDMFSQMRAAALQLRQVPWNGENPPPGSDYRDILKAATLGGARAAWMDDVTGSLAPGKSADLVILRPESRPATIDEAYAQVVWSGHVSNIESVLVAGREMLK